MPGLVEDGGGEAIGTKDGRAWCNVCCEFLPSDSPKGLKQHLKSKTHKQKSQGVGAAPEKHKKKRRGGEGEGDSEGEEEGFHCELCSRTGRQDTVHTLEELEAAVARGEEVSACFPPPWVESARGMLPAHRNPFMTPESGSIPSYPDGLDDCLDAYCNAGVNEGNQPPNVDIGGENERMKSMNGARRRLEQAAAREEVYWAALVVDAMKHPPWWPRPRDEATGAADPRCVAHGDVPAFNQVIVGAGPTDIGIHIDKAPCPPCTKGMDIMWVREGDECEGTRTAGGGAMGAAAPPGGCEGGASAGRVHVDTYITMAKGAKVVIMLPRHQNALYSAGSRFPLPNEVGEVRKIVQAGGYYFTLEPPRGRGMVTLFTPKGWHHWLLGHSDWHCIFGASRF